MNQMTAVEVVDAVDRYTISGIGYGLEGKVQHAAGTSASIDDAVLPYIIASDAKLVDGKVVGDPTEGALLVLAHKAGLDIEASRERFPRLATLPFDPTYKLMATFNSDDRRVGQRAWCAASSRERLPPSSAAPPAHSPRAPACRGTTALNRRRRTP